MCHDMLMSHTEEFRRDDTNQFAIDHVIYPNPHTNEWYTTHCTLLLESFNPAYVVDMLLIFVRQTLQWA